MTVMTGSQPAVSIKAGRPAGAVMDSVDSHVAGILSVIRPLPTRHLGLGEPGEELIPGRSWESNSLQLAYAAAQAGCAARRHRLIRDDQDGVLAAAHDQLATGDGMVLGNAQHSPAMPGSTWLLGPAPGACGCSRTRRTPRLPR